MWEFSNVENDWVLSSEVSQLQGQVTHLLSVGSLFQSIPNITSLYLHKDLPENKDLLAKGLSWCVWLIPIVGMYNNLNRTVFIDIAQACTTKLYI